MFISFALNAFSIQPKSVTETPEQRAQRILYAIQNSPDTISGGLLNKLRDKAQSGRLPQLFSINLDSIFPKAEVPGQPQSLSHCTRCHKEYDPNYPTQCQIEHNWEDADRTCKSSRGSEWQLKCCGLEFSSSSYDVWDSDDVRDPYCFDGDHTTEPHPEKQFDAQASCEEWGCPLIKTGT